MQTLPLRYNISNFRQLTQCLSNNSRDLRIHVAEIHANDTLTGLRISVEHCKIGTIFTYIVDACGDIVTEYGNQDKFHQLTTDQILAELERFGFYVTFNVKEHLSGAQIQYLMTVDKLGFNKLRILRVAKSLRGTVEYKDYVVVFKTVHHPRWLEGDYVASEREFENALIEGTAMNLNSVDDFVKFRWDWLDYVANIHDIILDNA